MDFEREYRGIEFVRISDLPDELRSEISSWVDVGALLKIKTDEALFRDCLLSKDFHYWFNNIHSTVNSWHENQGDSKTSLAVQVSPN